LTQRVPWLRIFAEGVAIVVSILLALAMQAWWEARQHRSAELELLNGIRNDLVASRAEITRVLEGSERAAEALQVFLASDARELRALPSDSAAQLLRMPVAFTFQPYEGALRTGDLLLIQSPTVRQLVGQWVGGAADIAEGNPLTLTQLDRVWVLMGANALMIRGDYGPPSNAQSPREILSLLRDNDDFLAARLALQAGADVSTRKLRVFLELTERLIEVLDEALEGADL